MLQKKKVENWEDEAKSRCILSLLILGTVVHFIVCLRTFEALNCVDTPEGKLLYIQQSQKCFVGSHTTLFVFVIIILIFYCIGFPITAFYALYQAKKYNHLEEMGINTFGIFCRGLKTRAYWYKLSIFAYNILVAAEVAFNMDPTAQLLVNACFFLTNILTLLLWRPYLIGKINFVFFVGGVVRIVYTLVLLATTEDAKASWIGFYILLAFFVIIVFTSLFWLVKRTMNRKALVKHLSLAQVALTDRWVPNSEDAEAAASDEKEINFNN